MNSKVTKALTPEEQTLVANIKSLLAELEGMQVADQEVEMSGHKAPMVEKMEPGEEEEVVGFEYDEEVDKAIENADADESVANDDAEDRLGDIPDVDEENVHEVAKMIAHALVQKSGKVRKAAPQRYDDAVAAALGEVTRVVKSMHQHQAKQDAVLSEVLEGLGVTQSVTGKKVQKSKPVQSMDMESLTQVFKAMSEANSKVGGVQNPSEGVNAGRSEVHKSMGSLLDALGGSNAWNQ